MRIEVRFAGDGGQGLVLAAMALADAAGVHGGLCVHQTQFYAPVIVGGPAYADVVISDHEQAFPWVTRPNVLVALTERAFIRYAAEISDGGTVIADPLLVASAASADPAHIHLVPATEIAERAGTRKATNMACLGAMSALLGHVLPLDHVQRAVSARSPQKFREANLTAVREGWNHARARAARRPVEA